MNRRIRILKGLTQVVGILAKCGGPGSGRPGPCPGFRNRVQSSDNGPDALDKFMEKINNQNRERMAKMATDKFHATDRKSDVDYYKSHMERDAEYLNKVHEAVSKISSKIDKGIEKYESLNQKLFDATNGSKAGTLNGREMEELQRETTRAKEAVFEMRDKRTDEAWQTIKKMSKPDQSYGNTDPIPKVKLANRRVSEFHDTEIDLVESRLSGVLSSKHKKQMEDSSFDAIPDGEKQRSHAIGTSIHLSKKADSTVVAHEFGHALETSVATGSLVRGFLVGRVAGQPAKHMGDGYDDDEVGFDDDFGKAFGSQARYVGKIYPGGETEVLSMGIEKLMKDPVNFAKMDPEHFKLTVGILNGVLL